MDTTYSSTMMYGPTAKVPNHSSIDVSDEKELNLESCKRTDLQRQCIKYFGPNEREAYEVVVEDGKLVYKQSGMPLNTTERSKWIFFLSTSRVLYVGKKKKGVFQHSSFLSGGATTAAGRLIVMMEFLRYTSQITQISTYVIIIFFCFISLTSVSFCTACNLATIGHYLPTEDSFTKFINFLEEHNVDLANIKKCAIDDDRLLSESNKDMEKTLSQNCDTVKAKDDGPVSDVLKITAHEENFTHTSKNKIEEPVFDLTKCLSCKWTSGLASCIGCVRDYPMDLQFQALETVNLSPRVHLSQPKNCNPIPSPCPSPKIRISPRLVYMGLPIPRVSVTTL